MEVHAPDLHHLKAAVGWLELGNAAEALVELDQMNPALQHHPDVLETRWLALAETKVWDTAVEVARNLITAAPHRALGWLHHSYALRRASNGGLLAAFNALAPVAPKFPEEATIPYNLACYCCQLERDPAETMRWLQQAIAVGGRKDILAMALQDPDLKPLSAEIQKLKPGV